MLVIALNEYSALGGGTYIPTQIFPIFMTIATGHYPKVAMIFICFALKLTKWIAGNFRVTVKQHDWGNHHVTMIVYVLSWIIII